MNINIDKKVFNDIYLPYLEDYDSRYLVFYGGGSSGKSYFIVQRWVYKLLKCKMNLLVVRQTGDTNRNSTFALFMQVISNWNMGSLFDISESNLRIRCKNGNEVIFKGLDDVEKVKSTTFKSGELTDIWVEEATECDESDINQLKVRLRGGSSKKQMVLSFNPINITHWIKRHFVDGEVEKATICFSTYKDNKFLSDADKQVLENFKNLNPYYYEVYCLGHWGTLGKSYFDSERVNRRIEELEAPYKRGYFNYVYSEKYQRIISFEWVDDARNGFIKIYEDVEPRTPYAIGGDTAGEGSDFFTAHVINNVTGRQVCVLRREFDEIEYTRQMYCLGLYYNNALVGIEANFSTYPIKELDRLGYNNQFIRTTEDTYKNGKKSSFGFKTTRVTRPLILAELQRIVVEKIYLINDRETLEEMLTFIVNDRGRAEADDNAHDDLVMGLAIAFYIKEWQSKNYKKVLPKIQVAPDFSPFGVESDYQGVDDLVNTHDYGEELVRV